MYYHLLTKEEAQEALTLPDSLFQRSFKRPEGCGFAGAIDRRFGCPHLFRSERDRTRVAFRCHACPCWEKPLKVPPRARR